MLHGAQQLPALNAGDVRRCNQAIPFTTTKSVPGLPAHVTIVSSDDVRQTDRKGAAATR